MGSSNLVMPSTAAAERLEVLSAGFGIRISVDRDGLLTLSDDA